MRLISRVLRARWLAWSNLAAVGFLLVAGCSDGKIGRYQVNGSVNIDGKPAAGVAVFFCPVGGPPELQKMRPMGITGSDGKFQLTSIDKADGAPAGQYKVVMMWPAAAAPAQDGSVSMGPDRLRNRYMNPEKSQFTVEVKSGTNDVPPFELKSK